MVDEPAGRARARPRHRRRRRARPGHEPADDRARTGAFSIDVADCVALGQLQQAVAQQVTGVHGGLRSVLGCRSGDGGGRGDRLAGQIYRRPDCANLPPCGRLAHAPTAAPAPPRRPRHDHGRRLTSTTTATGSGAPPTVLRANAGACRARRAGPDLPRRGRCSTSSRTRAWSTAGPPSLRLRGDERRRTQALEREGRARADLLGWFDDGATALLQAIVDAPDDLDALVFLKDAPRRPAVLGPAPVPRDDDPRGRRDGARLGRPAPRPTETWIKPSRRARRHRRAARRLRHPPQGGRVARAPPHGCSCAPTARHVAWLVEPRAGSADLHPAGRARLAPEAARRRPRPHRRRRRPLPPPVEPRRAPSRADGSSAGGATPSPSPGDPRRAP